MMILSTGKKNHLNSQQNRPSLLFPIPRRHFAFTLIEMVLVIVILAVISAFAVPSFTKSFSSIQLQAAADDLVYLMRYAQSRAITQGKRLRVTFDSQFKKYWLEQDQTDDTFFDSEPAYERIAGRLGKAVFFPKEVKVKSDKSNIDFGIDGSMSTAVILLSNKRKCLQISIRYFSKDVQLEDCPESSQK